MDWRKFIISAKQKRQKFTNFLLVSFRKSSGILSKNTIRQQDHAPLPHLHSIVINSKNSPIFVVSERPTIYLISSIVRFFNDAQDSNLPIDNGRWLNDGLIAYIENFTQNSNWSMAMNWFLRREITFVLDMLKSKAFKQKINRKLQLITAYKVLNCLDETQINDVLVIFNQFIFNSQLYDTEIDAKTVNEWKSIYARIFIESFFNRAEENVSIFS